MRAMLSLTWQQVDLTNKRAWVSSSEMKTGPLFGNPLTPVTVQILKRLLHNGDHVFQ